MRTFKPHTPNQLLLLPSALQDWLPEGHLALFISDVVDRALDLTPILATYETGDDRGQPPYRPALMVKRLVCAYCTGKPSSRQIEPYDEVPYRVLAANQHPDHDTLAAFRQQHLPALAGLFTQVLALCRQAGLVTLGHVPFDGTKVVANASKHKAMSYTRMPAAEQRLQEEIAALLAETQRVDGAEDGQYGKGKRGDDLPAELARRESRPGGGGEGRGGPGGRRGPGEACRAAAAIGGHGPDAGGPTGPAPGVRRCPAPGAAPWRPGSGCRPRTS
jgi:transposase